jgi:hypothetical protein
MTALIIGLAAFAVGCIGVAIHHYAHAAGYTAGYWAGFNNGNRARFGLSPKRAVGIPSNDDEVTAVDRRLS